MVNAATHRGIVQGGEVFSIVKPHANPKQLQEVLKKHCKPRKRMKLPVDIIHPSVPSLKCIDHAYNEGDFTWSRYSTDMFSYVERLKLHCIYVNVLEIVSMLEPDPLYIVMDVENDSAPSGDRAMGVDVSSRVNNKPTGTHQAGRKAMDVSDLQIKKNRIIKQKAAKYTQYFADIFDKTATIRQDFERFLLWHLSLGLIPLRNKAKRDALLKNVNHTQVNSIDLVHLGCTINAAITASSGIVAGGDGAKRQRVCDDMVDKIITLYTSALSMMPPISLSKKDKLNIIVTEYGGIITVTNYAGDAIDYIRLNGNSNEDDGGGGGADHSDDRWAGAGSSCDFDADLDFITRTESLLSKMFDAECQYKFVVNNQNSQAIKRETQTLIVVKTLSGSELQDTLDKISGDDGKADKKDGKRKLPKTVTDQYIDCELTKIEKKMKTLDDRMPTSVRRVLGNMPTLAKMAKMTGMMNDDDDDECNDGDNSGSSGVIGESGSALAANPMYKSREDLARQERLELLNDALNGGSKTNIFSVYNSTGIDGSNGLGDAGGQGNALRNVRFRGVPTAMEAATGSRTTKKKQKRYYEEMVLTDELKRVTKEKTELSKRVNSMEKEHGYLENKLHQLSVQCKIKELTANQLDTDLKTLKATVQHQDKVITTTSEDLLKLHSLLKELLRDANMSDEEKRQYMNILLRTNKKRSRNGGTTAVAAASAIGGDVNQLIGGMAFTGVGGIEIDATRAIHSLLRVIGSGSGSIEQRGRSKFVKQSDPLDFMTKETVHFMMSELNLISKAVFPHAQSKMIMEFNNSILPAPWMADRLLNEMVTESDPLHKPPSNIVMDTLQLKMIDVSPLDGTHQRVLDLEREANYQRQLNSSYRASGLVESPKLTESVSRKYMNAIFPTHSDSNRIGDNLKAMYEQEFRREFLLNCNTFTETGRELTPYITGSTVMKFVIPYLRMALPHVLNFDRVDQYINLLTTLEKSYQAGHYDGGIQGLLELFFDNKVIFTNTQDDLTTATLRTT